MKDEAIISHVYFSKYYCIYFHFPQHIAGANRVNYLSFQPCRLGANLNIIKNRHIVLGPTFYSILCISEFEFSHHIYITLDKASLYMYLYTYNVHCTRNI